MKSEETRYPDYPVFKGLQRPLELMGIQGRYIYWAAGTAGGSHCRLHCCLLPARFCCRTDSPDGYPFGRYLTDHRETKTGTALQTN